MCHYKQLTEYISEVEEIEGKVNSKKKGLTKKEEEKKKSTLAAARTVKTIRILDFLFGEDEKI